MNTLTEDKEMQNIEDKKTQIEKHLSPSIALAIELEGNFKLYSFRIIDPETFMARTKELVEQFQKLTK